MELTWENSNPVQACFISSRDRFIDNKARGLDYLKKYNFLGHDLLGTPECIYADLEDFKKYRESKILVVGAGPTTNERDWSASDYDYIFSCNHFYLNKKLQKARVDLCLVCNELDLNDKDFLRYVTENKTNVGFEDYNKDISHVHDLSKKIKGRVFQCLTRFQGKIGVAPKLIILAVALGARQVDFVGVDGTPKDYRQGQISTHSFEKNKVFVDSYPYDLLLSHYSSLKKYLDQIGRGVTYTNLGAGHEYNCLSKV
jgi:hypothetical protein